MRAILPTLGFLVPVLAFADVARGGAGQEIEFAGLRYTAAVPADVTNAKQQKPPMPLLHQWTREERSYFYDPSPDPNGRKGLRFQRIRPYLGARNEEYTGSNVAITATSRDLKSIPNLELWTDNWGRIHSLAVLRTQVDFNGAVWKERMLRHNPEAFPALPLWRDFAAAYDARIKDLSKALDPDAVPQQVLLTGLLDRDTLKIPCKNLRMRRARLQAALLLRCARSRGEPCLAAPMPEASLESFKELVDSAGKAINACEAEAEAVAMMPKELHYPGSSSFGRDQLAGLRDIPVPPLSQRDQEGFEKGYPLVFGFLEHAPEAYVIDYADPTVPETLNGLRSEQGKAAKAVEKAEDAAGRGFN